MRVLFTTYPEKTHFYQMVPLAWALRAAGHDVLVASMPSLAETVTRAGLAFAPIEKLDRYSYMLMRNPEWLDDSEPEIPPYDKAALPLGRVPWRYLRDGMVRQVPRWHQLCNQPMVPELVELARSWRPDLVVWETTTYAGSIAASAVGAAHVRYVWSVDMFARTRAHFRHAAEAVPEADRVDPLADWLGGYAEQFGFEYGEQLITGQLTVDQLPESLRLPTDVPHLSMRWTPYGGKAVVPDWLRNLPDRPRLAVTLGMSAVEYDVGYIVDVEELMPTLGALDIEVVATIAEREQRRLGRVPDNVRLTPYVPLHALAARCTAAIHHGGPGTTATLSAAGLPQVAIPWDFDEPALAARLADQGAGLSVRADRATSSAIRGALLRLLGNPQFTERAAALRAEIYAQPSASMIVPQLEELAATARSGAGC